jgi:TRAP-type C4-dicarboxylate transport system permease small subunit
MSTAMKVINKITSSGGILGGIIFAAMALETFYGVLMRYVFRSPAFWNEEITRYLLTWGTMSAMAFAMMKRRHIRTRVLLDRVSPKTRVLLELFTDVVALVLLVVFIYTSTNLTLHTFLIGKKSITPLRFPLWIPQIALPIGGVFFFLQFVEKLVEDLPVFRKEWGSHPNTQP